MLRLITIILFITVLTGCTVVKPMDRAEMNKATQLAASQAASSTAK